MQNTPSKFNINYAYVARKEIEAHVLRAQTLSKIIEEIRSDITSIFSGTVNWFVKRNKNKRLSNELNGLSDHMLSDIGISRGEINGIVNGTFDFARRQSAPSNIAVLKQPKASAPAQTQHVETPIAA